MFFNIDIIYLSTALTHFSSKNCETFPKHKPSPMDKTYEDLAQKVYAESSRNDESRSANYEFPDDVPIESSEEKRTAVEKQLKYQRLELKYIICILHEVIECIITALIGR